MKGSNIPNYYFYVIDRHLRRKGATAVAVRKYIPHTEVSTKCHSLSLGVKFHP
jgi:hypothetical protein